MELCYNIIFYFCSGIYGWHLKCGWKHDLLPSPPKKVEKAISTVHRQILVLPQNSILSVSIIGVMPVITPTQIHVPANPNANLFLFSNKNVNFGMLVRIKPLKYTFFFYNTLLRLLDYLKICQLFYLFKIFLNF